MKNKKSNGFTLSEALIAVAIVGIISALTIPNVVSHYQNQTFVTSLKKVYADLQQNLTVLQTENYRNKGLYGSKLHLQDDDSIASTTGQFLTEYYKVNKDCETDTQPCFAAAYGSINSNGDTNFDCEGYSVLLTSGTALCMIPATLTVTEDPDNPENEVTVGTPVIVYIDTNGPDLPNIGGRDMFTFNIYEDFSIDEVSPDDVKNGTAEANRNTLYDDNCLTSSTGVGCFGRLLNNNWNMNY